MKIRNTAEAWVCLTLPAMLLCAQVEVTPTCTSCASNVVANCGRYTDGQGSPLEDTGLVAVDVCPIISTQAPTCTDCAAGFWGVSLSQAIELPQYRDQGRPLASSIKAFRPMVALGPEQDLQFRACHSILVQATPSEACAGDCSQLALDPNCIEWTSGISTAEAPATTMSKLPEELCPLGSKSEPKCNICAQGYYLVGWFKHAFLAPRN